MNARSTPLIRFGFLIAGILVLAFPVNLPAWDNLNAHGAISESAAYYFKNLHGPDLKYGNSSFDFSTTFQGRSYKVDYARLNEYTGHQPSLNFVSWMGEGGFTADVDPNTPPNGFTLVLTDKYMAMRHFFNATPGALRHLTDCFVVTWITDPPVNIIDWSIDFPGTKPSECHYYGFKQALQMYKAGLEQSNFIIDPWTTSNATETLFAAAFRALGETLHGTADLAVPAHVRNDGHGFGDNTFNWARVEPLEYTVFTQQIRGIVSLDPTSLSVPAEFDILGNPTPRVLMERLAKFTNENFYSQDTFNIPEWSVKPTNYLTSFPVAPDPPLPNLYDSSKEGQFGPIFLTKQFGNGKTVVMAKESPSSYLERSLSAGIIKKPRSFDIFKDQALSQAQVLVPAAVKACAEVIDRFWPTMVLSITGTPDTQNPGKYLVSGTLEHLIAQDMGSWNDLLPGQPIRYKGPGKIRKRNQGGSFDDLANVSFADASFTATPLTLTNGDVIKLQVWAGARVYLSPEHTVSGIVTGTPPAAPSNVLATKGNGSVTLTWDNVTGAASYTVYWSNTSGVTKANGTPLANKTTPFTHTGRTNGATYYYVVTAVNANGESVESTQVSATPQASTGNPLEITLDATTGLKMRFAQIPANTFTMGCPADEPGRWSSDWPAASGDVDEGVLHGGNRGHPGAVSEDHWNEPVLFHSHADELLQWVCRHLEPARRNGVVVRFRAVLQCAQRSTGLDPMLPKPGQQYDHRRHRHGDLRLGGDRLQTANRG